MVTDETRESSKTKLLLVNLGFFMRHIYWSRTEQLFVLYTGKNVHLIIPTIGRHSIRSSADNFPTFLSYKSSAYLSIHLIYWKCLYELVTGLLFENPLALLSKICSGDLVDAWVVFEIRMQFSTSKNVGVRCRNIINKKAAAALVSDTEG